MGSFFFREIILGCFAVVSHWKKLFLKAVQSITAEFRSQILNVHTGFKGLTAALCDSAWKAALSAALCVQVFNDLEYETGV